MQLGCTRNRQRSNTKGIHDSAPWVQPFDMPMAHAEVGRAGCSPMDTEVVVFVPGEDETTSSLWQRFGKEKEDDLDARDSITHIVVARAVPKKMKAVDPQRPTCGRFSYEGQGIQDATSMMLEDEHMVLTHDCAAEAQGPDFGDARLHALDLPSNPRALVFDDTKVPNAHAQQPALVALAPAPLSRRRWPLQVWAVPPITQTEPTESNFLYADVYS